MVYIGFRFVSCFTYTLGALFCNSENWKDYCIFTDSLGMNFNMFYREDKFSSMNILHFVFTALPFFSLSILPLHSFQVSKVLRHSMNVTNTMYSLLILPLRSGGQKMQLTDKQIKIWNNWHCDKICERNRYEEVTKTHLGGTSKLLWKKQNLKCLSWCERNFAMHAWYKFYVKLLKIWDALSLRWILKRSN